MDAIVRLCKERDDLKAEVERLKCALNEALEWNWMDSDADPVLRKELRDLARRT